MRAAIRLNRPGRRILAALAPGRELNVSQISLTANLWPAKTTPVLASFESVGWIAGRASTPAEDNRPRFGGDGPLPSTRYYTITAAGREAACCTNARLRNRTRTANENGVTV